MANDGADINSKYDLIQRRIPVDYIWTPDLVKKALSRADRRPRVLWITSPTGNPHLGYLIPLLKFADFLRAGCELVVVILDTYSYLDNIHFPMEQVLQRGEVYRFTVQAALKSFGVDSARVKFVYESSYDKSLPFIRDQWKLCTLMSQEDIRNSWDRAVHPHMLSPMLCPVLQTLSEEYTDCDIHFGGDDQRSLFELANRYLPQVGYRTRAHIINPMLPNLQSAKGSKMSSSHPPHTKLTYTESNSSIRQKLQLAWESTRSHRDKCGPLHILRDILIPISLLQQERAANAEHCQIVGIFDAGLKSPFWTPTAPSKTLFTVIEGDKTLHFQSFEQILSGLDSDELTENSLRDAISDAVCQIVGSTRTAFERDAKWQDAYVKGYPGGEDGVFGH